MLLERKKYRKRTYLTLFFSVASIFSFGASFLSPETWWVLGFMAWSLPIWIGMNVLLLFYWLSSRKFQFLIPVITLVICYSFFFRTIGTTFSSKQPSADFQLLSLNAQVFQTYTHLRKDNPNISQNFINWLAKHPAEIKCIQEFYHLASSEVYNTIKKVGSEQNYQVAIHSQENPNSERGIFGVAIFSRFPIINQGEIPLAEKTYQQGIYADIVIAERDTIRVFNIHLSSMSIDREAILDENIEAENKYKDLFHRLKEGFQKRASQVDILKKYILESPYPVVVCGDFNDLPYSYTYQKMSSLLNNSFEEAGFGLGFTYTQFPFYLRIDHQFCAERFQVSSFETLNGIRFSDHSPLLVKYHLSN